MIFLEFYVGKKIYAIDHKIIIILYILKNKWQIWDSNIESYDILLKTLLSKLVDIFQKLSLLLLYIFLA